MKKVFSYVSLLSIIPPVYGAVPETTAIPLSIAPPMNLRTTNIATLISGTIGVILFVAAFAAFIFLIWGGIQWITSGGDKSKVEGAQHRIQAAILGLFIVFASWAIMLLLGQFFGFDVFNPIIPKGYDVK